MVAGGAGELFGVGIPNLTPCRQCPIGRAGRAQDAQAATFRPAPTGITPAALRGLWGFLGGFVAV